VESHLPKFSWETSAKYFSEYYVFDIFCVFNGTLDKLQELFQEEREKLHYRA